MKEYYYEGEFGPEIATFIPMVFTQHLLHGSDLVVSTYVGMQPYYCFLPEDLLLLREGPRNYIQPSERNYRYSNEHYSETNNLLLYPIYQQLINESPSPYSYKVFIHNKSLHEWNLNRVNCFPTSVLGALDELLHPNIEIVYSRMDSQPHIFDKLRDHQEPFDEFDYRERELAAFQKNNRTFFLEEFESSVAGYNHRKLIEMCKSDFHVSVQGGHNYLYGLIGETKAVIFHIAGEEIKFAYRSGFFANAQKRGLDLAVVDNFEDNTIALVAKAINEDYQRKFALDQFSNFLQWERLKARSYRLLELQYKARGD